MQHRAQGETAGVHDRWERAWISRTGSQTCGRTNSAYDSRAVPLPPRPSWIRHTPWNACHTLAVQSVSEHMQQHTSCMCCQLHSARLLLRSAHAKNATSNTAADTVSRVAADLLTTPAQNPLFTRHKAMSRGAAGTSGHGP